MLSADAADVAAGVTGRPGPSRHGALDLLADPLGERIEPALGVADVDGGESEGRDELQQPDHQARG